MYKTFFSLSPAKTPFERRRRCRHIIIITTTVRVGRVAWRPEREITNASDMTTTAARMFARVSVQTQVGVVVKQSHPIVFAGPFSRP